MKSLNDFNSHQMVSGLTLSRFSSKEETREPRTNRICATHQLSLAPRIQSLCGSLRRPQARATVLMLGPIPDHGVCPINLPREFARHRSVSASSRPQALSLWLQWSNQTFHAGRRQRDPRLENLCRLCPESDSDRPALVRRHRPGSGTRRHRLFALRDHHRSLSVALSLGQVPPGQRRPQTAHAARDSQRNPSIYRHYRGVAARRQRPRSPAAAAWFIHRHGSRLRRFRAPLSIASGPDFLCHSGQRQLELPPPLFASGRSPRGHSQRSNHRASRTKEFVALSHGATPSQLSFARNRSATGAIDHNFSIPALSVAGLYRYRWQIELFFKWIKQHLRIKRFFGTSINSVKTQIWIAVSVYVLVAIVKQRLGLGLSLYTILQILSLTLFEKTPLLQVFEDFHDNFEMLDNVNQLKLFDI